jgi:phosphatidylinositol alpha-mannosyltransferase
MNIGMVSPYDWDFPGGVNRHVEQLSRQLRSRGHQVTVIAPGGRGREDYFSVGGSFALPSNRSVAHLSFGPGTAARLKRFLSRNRFDLLHLHEPLIPSASFLALLFSRTANLATFHAAREGGSRGYALARPLLSPLAGKLHLRAAVSPAALELVSRYFPGDYRILPNGVDTDEFKPRGGVLEACAGGQTNLLFVGRDEPRKGLRVLLEALPRVRERHPEVRLLVVGAERNGRDAEGVIWLGRLPDEKMPDAYRSAHIMVAPALGGESFGVILIEAMACGLPVVASDIPGYRAVVEEGVQGTLVPPGDARALADGLLGLVEDRGLRDGMARAALRRAEEFSWRRLVADVEEAYEAAINRFKGVPDAVA